MHERLYMARQGQLRALFFLALIGVTMLALWPGAANPPAIYGSDKIHHVAAFFTLGALITLGWPPGPLARAVRSFTLLFAYGLAIELIQSLPLIGRSASVYDLGADLIGIIAGMALILVWQRS